MIQVSQSTKKSDEIFPVPPIQVMLSSPVPYEPDKYNLRSVFNPK
jgi:hypothetical protein